VGLCDQNQSFAALLIGLVALGSACSTEPSIDPCEQPDSLRADFADDFASLNAEFGNDKAPLFHSAECADNPKADAFGFLPEPCDLLAPLIPFGEDALRMGFFVGAAGQGTWGPVVGNGGFDIVWDLYHQQLTVSTYAGGGVATPGLSVGGSVYAGAAFGFEQSVQDWQGYFVTGAVEVGLPYLQDFLNVGASVFVSGVDENDNGLIGPGEVLLPPDGVYGFGVSVGAGLSYLPPALPANGSLTEGLWTVHKEAIRELYDDFKNTKMFFTVPMKVRLVNHVDGTPCSEDWPYVDGDMSCVIEFGDPNDSYFKRAINTGYSICHVTGRCVMPLSWPMSVTALGIGALRDHNASFEDLCPAGVTQ
jgi:hypothetical protein